MHPRKDPARRCLTVEHWPEADRRAWQAARRHGDPLDGRGRAAHLTRHSVIKLEKGYGRWLTWLSLAGLLDSFVNPAERVTPERVAGYVASLQAINAPYTVLARVQELYQALTAMVPERNWTWIRRIERRLRRSVTPVRPKRPRLVPLRELIRFGRNLMRQAAGARGGTPLQCALLHRDGLIVAVLAARCPRRRNFTEIQIDRHLVKRGTGYWLIFEASETKTGDPFEAPIPDELVPGLERYLTEHRPLLLRRTGRWNRSNAGQNCRNALWISKDGSAMTEIAIHFRIIKLTEAKFGKALSMHLFRDCAATSIAEEDPDHVLITKSVLGHTTLRTSERHYNHARSLQAMRLFQAGIMKLRRTLEPPDWKALGGQSKSKPWTVTGTPKRRNCRKPRQGR